MPQVERFVGIGRRILHHGERTVCRYLLFAKLLVGVNIVKKSYPRCRSNDKVQESLYNIEVGNRLAVYFQIFAHLLCRCFGAFSRSLQQWERYQRKVSFKVCLCLLQLYHLCWNLCTVQFFYGCQCRSDYLVFYLHIVCLFIFGCKGTKNFVTFGNQHLT